MTFHKLIDFGYELQKPENYSRRQDSDFRQGNSNFLK